MQRSGHSPLKPRLPLVAFAVIGGLSLSLVVLGFLHEERPDWRRHQEEFRRLEVARAQTPSEREAAERLPVELRQIVVSELGRVDRCVTCHLGVEDPTYMGEEAPFGYHPDHDVHPFGRFGCTACHGGQGRATTVRDAHGHVPFWEEPMLPLEYVEASCGSCHDPTDNPAAPRLARGARLFEEAGCRGCHRLDAWGGTLGPDLDQPSHGEPRSPQWLLAHFLDPDAVVPDSAMPDYGFSQEDAEALTLLMLSRQWPDVSGYHGSRRTLESSELGRRLFQDKGCVGCHQLGGAGGVVGPPLDHVVTRRNEDWLMSHFRDPSTTSPGSVMPRFGFSDAEAASLILFLHQVHEEGPVTAETTPESRGAMLYKRYGCRGCHGANGSGGVFNRNSESGEQVPPLLYVKEGYTRDELRDRIRDGVPTVGKLEPEGPAPPLVMAGFGDRLSDGQIDDLISYLFSLYPDEEELDW